MAESIKIDDQLGCLKMADSGWDIEPRLIWINLINKSKITKFWQCFIICTSFPYKLPQLGCQRLCLRAASFFRIPWEPSPCHFRKLWLAFKSWPHYHRFCRCLAWRFCPRGLAYCKLNVHMRPRWYYFLCSLSSRQNNSQCSWGIRRL